jgi:hypothetical protein
MHNILSHILIFAVNPNSSVANTRPKRIIDKLRAVSGELCFNPASMAIGRETMLKSRRTPVRQPEFENGET